MRRIKLAMALAAVMMGVLGCIAGSDTSDLDTRLEKGKEYGIRAERYVGSVSATYAQLVKALGVPEQSDDNDALWIGQETTTSWAVYNSDMGQVDLCYSEGGEAEVCEGEPLEKKTSWDVCGDAGALDAVHGKLAEKK